MHRVASAALVGVPVAVADLIAAAGGQDLAWTRQFGTAASEAVGAVQVGADGMVALAGARTGQGVVGQPLLRRFQHGQLVSAVDLTPVGATTVAFSSDGGLVVAGAVPSQTGGSTDVLGGERGDGRCTNASADPVGPSPSRRPVVRPTT